MTLAGSASMTSIYSPMGPACRFFSQGTAIVISPMPAVSTRAETLGSKAKILRFRVTGSGTRSPFAGLRGTLVLGGGLLGGGLTGSAHTTVVLFGYGSGPGPEIISGEATILNPWCCLKLIRIKR